MSARSEIEYREQKRSERERAEIPLRQRIKAILENPRWINLLDAHGRNLFDQVAAAIDYDRPQM